MSSRRPKLIGSLNGPFCAYLMRQNLHNWTRPRSLGNKCPCCISKRSGNTSNLRDLIAATGLVILPKLDTTRRFFSPCDLEIWWMIPKNYRAPLLHCIKLCASAQIPRWIQTGVVVQKRSIRVKIGEFLSCVTLKFDAWPWKTIWHLFYATLSFAHHFKAICEFKLELQFENAQFESKSAIFFIPCDLEI